MPVLFEGVACYERHPGDASAREVGSERKFVTSDKVGKIRCRRDPSSSFGSFSAGAPCFRDTYTTMNGNIVIFIPIGEPASGVFFAKKLNIPHPILKISRFLSKTERSSADALLNEEATCENSILADRGSWIHPVYKKCQIYLYR